MSPATEIVLKKPQKPFSHTVYQVRKKVMSILGASFHVFDKDGNVVLYSHMKAFRFKEDIRIYTDESKSQELLMIKARGILDFGGTYDVIDSTTQQTIGALRRKGIKSMFKDEWAILNQKDQEIGVIAEDHLALALIRRYACKFIPQHFEATIGDRPVCTYKQNFNPFVLKINMDFSADKHDLFDRRLGIASAILLCAIEGRQK